MSCFSQKTCHLRNFSANDVPKYTILARPNSQAMQTKQPSMHHEMACASTKTATTSPTSGNAYVGEPEPELQVLQRNCTEIHTSWSSKSPSDQNSVPSVRQASAVDLISTRSFIEHTQSGANSWLLERLPEKTPLSRVNELSRFNKLSSEFALVAEEGPPHQKTFYVQLTLGEEVYHGSASSMKKAQHSVANMALERTRYPHPPFKCVRSLRQVPPAAISKSDIMKCTTGISHQQTVSTEIVDGDPTSSQPILDSHNKAADSGGVEKIDVPEKSVINEVQELAVKMGFLTVYDTDEESQTTNGCYTISCTCGSAVTHGRGTTKKAAKKVAAANMLEVLKSAAQCTVSELENTRLTKKSHSKKKKLKGLAKLSPDNEPSVDGSHLSFAVRLFQVQQAKRGSPPVYKDIGIKAGEFHTEVTIDGVTCYGVGKTKKQSKQDAASKMLQVLGFPECCVQAASANITSTPLPAKSALKKTSASPSGFSSSDKKVTFIDPERGSEPDPSFEVVDRVAPFPSTCPNGQPRKVQILKRPTKDDGSKSTLSSLEKTLKESALSSEKLLQIVDAQDQPADQRLHQLAAYMCLKVQFVDLPQLPNVEEHVSMVTLSTDPPLINHGSGQTLELARIAASRELLAMLKEFDVLQTLFKGKCERVTPTES